MNNIQPPQQLSNSRKGMTWRKQNVDFADSMMHRNYSLIRQSYAHKVINYDLVRGKLHMDDLKAVLNPEGITAGFIPDQIQHYPIMNAKMNVLKGEESKREFNYSVVVTNPDSVSEIEETKKEEVFKSLQQLIQDESVSQDDFQKRLDKMNHYFSFEYQDFRENTANCLLHHYSRQDNMPAIFNLGFGDGMTVGEEIYQCDVVGGEPVLEKLNPKKVSIYRSGSSDKIEDADMIVIDDYWPIGKIYDRYYDSLSSSDLKKIEDMYLNASSGNVDSMDNINEAEGFVRVDMVGDEVVDSSLLFDPFGQFSHTPSNNLSPFDSEGNVRVMRVYWKSRRKIKKIKFYNEDGDEEFTFMYENYTPNTYKGEEEESLWVNEAWEGTKIGKDIYVNIQPRLIQYNEIDNPSKCHFGIIGTLYNINDDQPYSLVDMMKPYAYLYDVIHDRLNKMMARNWGKMVRLDFSRKPKNWTIEKWLYYAKNMGLYIENSFNEGTYGMATGKIAAAYGNGGQSVIDADFGNNIQQYINLLEYIKQEMADVAGISKQREGQVSNRETVGGVERATLQSSHITEWLFIRHEDTKKRALECWLDTAKFAFKGKHKKFWYILPDASKIYMDVDGDEFCSHSYGIVLDVSNNIQDLNQKIETLAQAALQNQKLSFSTIMKLYMSASLSEKQRMIEADEQKMMENEQQQQQQQLQLQQQQLQMQQQIAQQENQLKDQMNQRDNETKTAVAEINSQAELAVLQLKNDMTKFDQLQDNQPEEYTQEAKDKLMLEMKKLDENMRLKREELAFQKSKAAKDQQLKEKQINAQAARRAAQK